MVDITIAIPTYNGEHRLPELLERLRSQINIQDISCEVVVVDNNSRDDTASVVQSYQSAFPYPLRYCLETRQGAAFARKRAVREANGHLVGFLDDDNLPSLTWVAEAYAFGQAHPEAGAYGSQIHGEFEVPPPANFERIRPFFAITERGSIPLRYEQNKLVLPPSAGLVVRKQAWLDNVPPQPILSGRVDDCMVTGEDLEAIIQIQRSGWEIWYNPRMELTHKIPRGRLDRAYLLSFFRGIGLSRCVVRMLRYEPWQRPLMLGIYMLNDLRKIVSHLLKNHMAIKGDIVAACELELFISSLISPIYLLRKGYFRVKPIPVPSVNPKSALG
ncbi:MAG TPA: hormogonium polysaccharide biosynthesis glycosyltransferase HpsE [Chroococcidiopsis sp.]